MRTIRLDAHGWSSPADFYAALLPKLGAPDWHGRNLDALYDGLCGGINAVEPPFAVEIAGTAELSPELVAFLAKVEEVFAGARAYPGHDVFLTLA
jgi:RNAse (barnase) inhibitor barstar